jgi:dipeptidyl aminopeptidase/acylaminoacyl peptidase
VSGKALSLVAVVFAFLMAAPAADAQYFGRNKVQYEELDFRILQTPHFDIYYYPREEPGVVHVARLAEQWYERLSQALDHRLSRRQVVILYESHPHFRQTNLVPGILSESTGGLTEAQKGRIVMPFAAGLAETSHVLGHELVHAFQYDIARHGRGSILMMPLWFIEGMAEYLTVGGDDTLTGTWMRDAVKYKRLPTLKQLDNPRYFPYRYGQAFWAFMADRFGRDVVRKALKAQDGQNAAARLHTVTGVTPTRLADDWHAWLRHRYQTPAGDGEAEKALRPIVMDGGSGGRLNVGPAISPDGRNLIFLSERDRLSIDVFLADAATGAVKRRILKTATDPHYDSLQFVDSAGAWDPSGRRFAFTAVGNGKAVLDILDIASGDLEREVRFDVLGQAFNATWSPDGRQIAFSALKGGLSDLYVYDLTSATLRQLTADPFADFQPAWSPDGRRLAFVTDRFSTDLRALRFGAYRLASIDLDSLAVRPLATAGGTGDRDPHWSADGESLFFLSDRRAVTGLYRLDVATGAVFELAAGGHGIGGVTHLSPGLSVASDAGTIVFSRYRNDRYEICRLEPAAVAARAVALDALPPATAVTAPTAAPSATLEASAATARAGSGDRVVPTATAGPGESLIASAEGFTVRRYRPTLSFDGIGQPYVSAGGSAFGGFLRAGMSFSFGDMLRDQQVDAAIQVGRRVHDFAGRVVYLNRRSRWNWGGALDVFPALFGRSIGTPTDVNGQPALSRQTVYMRQMHQGASGIAVYPFNRSKRLEFAGGLHRISFTREIDTRVIASGSGRVLSKAREETRAAAPVMLGEASVALVYDNAVLGPTSPILGTRYRFEVAPSTGSLSFTTLVADYRRYLMPVRPVTVAMRARFTGRYGADSADARLLPLVLGIRNDVRGYDIRSVTGGCRGASADCSLLDVMAGSRMMQANVELRLPLPGVFAGKFDYGPVPLEAIVFADSGMLWTRDPSTVNLWRRDLLRSLGAGVRANAGGMIFELAWVRPFDRPDRGWTLSFNLTPGF